MILITVGTAIVVLGEHYVRGRVWRFRLAVARMQPLTVISGEGSRGRQNNGRASYSDVGSPLFSSGPVMEAKQQVGEQREQEDLKYKMKPSFQLY